MDSTDFSKNNIIGACFLTLFFVIAGNGTVIDGLLLLLVVLFALFFSVWFKHNIKRYMLYSAGYLLGFVMNVAAPGTSARADVMGTPKGVLYSIVTDFVWGQHYFMEFTNSTLILVSIAVVIFLCGIIGKTQFRFRYPAVVAFVSFGLFCTQFSSLIMSGYVVESEDISFYTRNIIYCSFITLWFLNLVYLAGWLTHTISFKNRQNRLWAYAVLLLIAGMNLWVNREYVKWNSFAQVSLLHNNVCGAYYQEMLEREQMLSESDKKEIILPKSEYADEMLMFRRDTAQPGIDVSAYQNQLLMEYYHKSSVKTALE